MTGDTVTSDQTTESAVPGPRSAELHRRREAAVARGVSSVAPFYVAGARDSRLVDVDGRSYIDLTSVIAVANVGHAPKHVIEAIHAQAESFLHTCFMVAPYEQYVAVCERLNALTPGAFAKKSLLVNSGAEAVENAVKIARYATNRPAVVVFENAYHGRTNLTMAMTAKAHPYKDGFGPFAGEIYRAPMSYPFRDPAAMTGEEAAARAIDVIERYVGAARVACVVIEPIQGEGGFVVPAPGFLPTLRQWCSENDVLFVADEIQTGFGRTGHMFACEHESVVPDIMILGKALAGGLPLAAVTGRADLVDRVHPGGLGGTYGGNPVACAAALATLHLLEAMNAPARARGIEKIMRPRLDALAARYPFIGDVRGRGAMLALEVVRPGTKDPDAARTADIVRSSYDEGLAVLSCGMYSNVLRFLPPLSIDDALLVEAMNRLDHVFERVAAA
jgi:4-aminobutyrate aminotransferase/(S)-3-amino-2-methylpropionate transaminase